MLKGIGTQDPASIMDHIPSLKSGRLEVGREFFQERDPSKKVYYMRAADETNGLYGAKGKRLGRQKGTHFIDISV
ncbi:hypothetical protein ACFL9T_21445 [Thermodesulfobacteriota bacterium]